MQHGFYSDMKKVLFYLTLTVLCGYSCNSKSENELLEKYSECLNEIKRENSQNMEYSELINQLADTLYFFAGKNPHSHNPDKFDWQLDSFVIFEDENKKCLLFLLEISKFDATLDGIRIIRGDKADSSWEFTLYPHISVYRGNLPEDRPHTFQELSNKIKALMIQKNLFESKGCKQTDSFIENLI